MSKKIDEMEAIFLRAICVRPEDDLARLVYADWLDERGHTGDATRAKFIRLQIEIAQAQLKTGRYPGIYFDMLSETCSIAATHGKNWLAKLLPKAVIQQQTQNPITSTWFPRGFVEALAFPSHIFVQFPDVIFERTPLVEVHLVGALHQITQALRSPNLLRIKRLRITGIKNTTHALILAREFATSQMLKNLVELDLSNCAMNDRCATELCFNVQFAQLKVLRLNRNRLSYDGVTQLAMSENFKQLEILELQQCENLRGWEVELRRWFWPKIQTETRPV